MTQPGGRNPLAIRYAARLMLPLAILAAGAYLLAAAPPGESSAAQPAGDAAKGKKHYTTLCQSCHGEKAEGSKQFNSPSLSRQDGWYIVSQLQKFRVGHRGVNPKDSAGVLMRPMAQALPDEQALLDVAAYVTSLETPAPAPTLKGDIAAGKKQYDAVCAACHGARATGNADLKAPALVGQNDWYVADAIRKFKAGHRGFDPKDVTGAQMKAMAATLATDDAVRDVASYIASLAK